MIDVNRCFRHLGYTGSTEPTLDNLRELQNTFLMKVPFENLDIHLGREISLSPESIYRKIVLTERGGFCYECNILFRHLINALGFQAEYLSARMLSGTTVGPEYDHMVLLVNIGHDYLVDVGNGQSCREPLRIDGTNQALSEGLTYRAGTHGEDYALYYKQPDAAWTPRYLFTLTPRERSEFSDMCQYHQRSPDSIFTKHRLATIATTEGRITLTDMQLSITHGTEVQESVLSSDSEYNEVLEHYFGIKTTDGCF